MPPQQKLNEDIWSIYDKETDPIKRNKLLTGYLTSGAWRKLDIVLIRRIEVGDSGWSVIHRIKPTSGSQPGDTADNQD